MLFRSLFQSDRWETAWVLLDRTFHKTVTVPDQQNSELISAAQTTQQLTVLKLVA